MKRQETQETTVADVSVQPDAPGVAREAAERTVALARAAISANGRFTIALAGGATPRAMYTLLASDAFARRINWPAVHVFWGDERCVHPNDFGSNYGMVHQALLSHVPIPSQNVHRVLGESDPEVAAESYAEELGRIFRDAWPRFDLILLGLGTDGHTASLFPGAPVLEERKRAVVAVTAEYEDRPACRVTLTIPAINAARHVLFLVTGSSKAETLRAVLEGPPGRFPAQLIQPIRGQLAWLVDAAAAMQIRGGVRDVSERSAQIPAEEPACA